MSSTTGKTNKIILITLLLLSGCGFSHPEVKDEPQQIIEQVKEEYPEIETTIDRIDKQGNIILNISVQQLNEKGYEAGDVITVTINGNNYDMPIGVMINEVSGEEEICLFENESGGNDIIKLAVKNDSFFLKTGLGEIKLTEEDPGYEILWNEGVDEALSVFLNMKEKQGHSDDYPTDDYAYRRTNNREEYPQLSDEEFANFREVETKGMKDDILYRSSSPINPKINRNTEADEAIRNAQVKTVINMTDYTNGVQRYDNYETSYYSSCNIIALNMSTNFSTEEFGNRLCEGFRFLIENEGPYLIHCTEGKDRTGFSIAILECLMGAEADEIVSDYMKTYCNYYGVKLGSSFYNSIAERNIKKDLAKAFGIDSIFEDDDLSLCAEKNLLKIGMSQEEISKLKEILQAE